MPAMPAMPAMALVLRYRPVRVVAPLPLPLLLPAVTVSMDRIMGRTIVDMLRPRLPGVTAASARACASTTTVATTTMAASAWPRWAVDRSWRVWTWTASQRACKSTTSKSTASKSTASKSTASMSTTNTNTSTSTSTSTSASATPTPTTTPPDDHLAAARRWLANLTPDTLALPALGELSFSRSSGPGGQNVNKVNSKATLRVPLATLLQKVPTALHRDISRSRYLAARSNHLVVSADESRRQADNAQTCYRRLYQDIADAARAAVPAEASHEQQRRVRNLQSADNERRLHSKKHQSAKKSSRRARGDD